MTRPRKPRVLWSNKVSRVRENGTVEHYYGPRHGWCPRMGSADHEAVLAALTHQVVRLKAQVARMKARARARKAKS